MGSLGSLRESEGSPGVGVVNGALPRVLKGLLAVLGASPSRVGGGRRRGKGRETLPGLRGRKGFEDWRLGLYTP